MKNPSEFLNTSPVLRIAIAPSSAFFSIKPPENLIRINFAVYEVVGIPSDHEIDIVPYRGDARPRVSITMGDLFREKPHMTSFRKRGAAVTKLFRMKKM